VSPPGWLAAFPPPPGTLTAGCRGCPQVIYRAPGGHRWLDARLSPWCLPPAPGRDGIAHVPLYGRALRREPP
jgi:hypothetical protein